MEQYERGGMTAQAKNAIDRSLDVLSAGLPGNGHPSPRDPSADGDSDAG